MEWECMEMNVYCGCFPGEVINVRDLRCESALVGYIYVGLK